MARKFTPADRAALTVPGLSVEWLDGSHWKAGHVDTGEIVTVDGYQHIVVINDVTTRTISAGHVVQAGPRRVRAAS